MFYRNAEAALGGKVRRFPFIEWFGPIMAFFQSDPYVRVQLNNVTVDRTDVVNNSKPFFSLIVLVTDDVYRSQS